jgi:prepilin-type N-terminal cleavage/methylation domain-containing protein
MNSACQNKTSFFGQKGFTLIEVMIALMILVMIGLLTSKAIIEAAKLKQKLTLETDFSSELRTSLTFIERDLTQVFNPRWLLAPDMVPLDPYAQQNNPQQNANDAEKNKSNPTLSIDDLNRRLRGMAFQTFEYWGPVLDPSGIRASRFQGKEDQMSFISASHQRVYKEKKESIYIKIKYEFIKDTLYKTINTRAFDLEDTKDMPSITRYEVLKHIKTLKFGYFKPEEKSPLRSWDSEGQDQKGNFPEAIEMEVSLDAPEGKTFNTTLLFKLETPNNVLPKTY